MHITFAVFFLLIAHAISYPSLRNIASDDDESNEGLQLELRSILKHLANEQIERSITSDEDSSDDYEKRQGGYNIIKADLKCEIECVGNLRNPETGNGLSIKKATEACKNICAQAYKKTN
ncbi:hypothetical protein I4U23_004085 [Adineta vaga]|nr:hypothetical protein I4U23_004085 [Adineta vaga]